MPASIEDSWGVGRILYCAWGYDQTTVEFYRIVKRTAATVSIVRLTEEIVEHDPQSMLGRVIAGQETVGEPIKGKRIAMRGTAYESIKLSDYKRAYPWDGAPKHFSYYG